MSDALLPADGTKVETGTTPVLPQNGMAATEKGVTVEEGPETEPSKPNLFADAYDHLSSWFSVLGPPRVEDETRANLDKIPPFEERLDYIKVLEGATENTLKAGTALPFEAFVRGNALDVVSRLILLALLRSALDPQSAGGIRLIKIIHALGANDVGRQREIRHRLDNESDLRDLELIECVPFLDLTQRLYRLPYRMVDLLTDGVGDGLGLPDIRVNQLQALTALAYDVRRLMDAVPMPAHETENMWQGPRPGRPGWDWTLLRRRKLAARLEAAYRSESDAIGKELRRLQLEGTERLAWAMLYHDSGAEQVGLPIPFGLSFCGCEEDAEIAAQCLLGPNSKLAKAGGLRFNRNDGPLLGRLVALSQEARNRVALWPRLAFVNKPGASLDLAGDDQRALGFASNGSNGSTSIQDRTASLRAAAGGAS